MLRLLKVKLKADWSTSILKRDYSYLDRAPPSAANRARWCLLMEANSDISTDR